MIKYLFSLILSGAALILIAQEDRNIEVSIRLNEQLNITDTREINSVSDDGEKTISYKIDLTVNILNNTNGRIQLELMPTDFTLSASDKKSMSTYNSANELDYQKKKSKLKYSSAIVEYDTNPNALNDGPVLNKGVEEFNPVFKKLVNAKYHKELDELISTSYILDIVTRLFPLENSSRLQKDGDYGYPMKKEETESGSLISTLTITPSAIEMSNALFTIALDESEQIYDPSTMYNTHITVEGSGELNVNLKNGTLIRSIELINSVREVKDQKLAQIEISTKSEIRTINCE